MARLISELTGLSRGLVDEKNLRISDGTFFVEARHSRGLIVGRLEARVTGRWPPAAPETGSSTRVSRP